MAKQITMIELFSGIGAQERAIKQLGIPYEVIHTCDCDKDAVLSYAAMRNNFNNAIKNFEFPSQAKMINELQAKNIGFDFQKNKHSITNRTPIKKLKQYYLADKLSHNLGDIAKVTRLPYADLITYSFPCTNVSVAGKGEGLVNKCNCGYSWPIDFSNSDEALICPQCGGVVASSTQSGLLGQVQRLLAKACEDNELPKYLLLENVKNLVGKKFKPQFDAWTNWLDSIGYNTYYKVLNAKHYGIPQNRERVFAISIRKDIDTNGFTFPEPISLTTRLKDILEKNVDEKYYLSDKHVEKILNSTMMQKKENEPQIIKVGQVSSEGSQAGMVYSPEGLSPTICAGCHGYAMGNILEQAEPVIIEDFYQNREPRVYKETAPTLRSERIGLKVAADVRPELVGGIGEKNFGKQYRQGNRVYNSETVAMALNAQPVGNTGGYSYLYAIKEHTRWRIRKLTTKECWRLMGFSDVDHDKAAEYVSDSALYKQAGNSICTCCLVSIFYSLFFNDSSSNYAQYLINFSD